MKGSERTQGTHAQETQRNALRRGERSMAQQQELTVQERPPWVDDASVKTCRNCNKDFGVFTRKVTLLLIFFTRIFAKIILFFFHVLSSNLLAPLQVYTTSSSSSSSSSRLLFIVCSPLLSSLHHSLSEQTDDVGTSFVTVVHLLLLSFHLLCAILIPRGYALAASLHLLRN